MTTHTVQSGDSMWRIARDHGVSAQELIAANPQVQNPSVIMPGQVLVVPQAVEAPEVNVGAAPPPAAAGVVPHAPDSHRGETRVYRVERGDTMTTIAARHGMSLQALLGANPQIDNPNVIHVGQTIMIAPSEGPQPAPDAPANNSNNDTITGTYTVVAGDNLSKIANRHHISLQALITANPQIRNPSLIRVGQVITIPGGSAHVHAAVPPVGPLPPDASVGAGNALPFEVFPVGGGLYNIGWDQRWDAFSASEDPRHNSDFSRRATNESHPNGHLGVDVFAPRGAPIVAPLDAEVARISRQDTGRGGLTVTLRSNNIYYYFAHLDSVDSSLRVGDQLAAGHPLGTNGDSGNARGTAPHLHFSMYEGAGGYSSHTINPFPYLMAAAEQDHEHAIS